MALLAGLLTSPILAQEKTRLVIHSDVPTEVWTADGKRIGKSDKAFALDLSTISPNGLTLNLKAEGFEDRVLSLSREELARAKRLPENGVYTMKALGSNTRQWTGGLVLFAAFFVGATVWKFRSSGHQRKGGSKEKLSSLPLGPLLGEGNMARVYESKTLGPKGEKLAIKILRPEVAQDEVARQRFLREIEVGKKLDHRHLVKFFEAGVDELGQSYLISEMLEGEDLATILRRSPRPDIAVVRNIVFSLCSALIYLHDRNIIHRDLKPANIFMTKGGEVKLVDLGIAAGVDLVALTQTGMAVGTPFYMAPEQSSGEASLSSDQYSLGVLVFEMLTGQLPFKGDDAIEIISKHLSTAPPSLCALNPDVTSLQEDVVLRLLSKEPTARFPDVKTAREALESAFTAAEDCDDTMAVAAS